MTQGTQDTKATGAGAPAASTGAAAGAPDDRATEFKAVDAQAGEQYSGSTLLVEAYAAIWLVIMGFILVLWRKQASLSERLEGLERAIDRASAAAERKAKASKSS